MPSALDRLEALSSPPRRPAPGSPRKRGIGAAIVAVLTFLVLKGKWVALLFLGKLKLVGLVGLKLLQFIPTLGTMILSTALYSAYGGWALAGLLVGLIFIHELGHGAAGRYLGLHVGAPIFIPFFGAMISIRGTRNPYEAFVVSAGGPLVGGIASLLVLAASLVPADPGTAQLLHVAGYLALVINLFNLMPAVFLDGKAMFRALGRREALAGLAAAAAVCAATAAAGHLNVVALSVLAVGAFHVGAAVWRARRVPPTRNLLDRIDADSRPAPAGNEDLPAAPLRLRAAIVYFGMVAGYTAAVQLLMPR